jgi:hypothetical protein
MDVTPIRVYYQGCCWLLERWTRQIAAIFNCGVSTLVLWLNGPMVLCSFPQWKDGFLDSI